MLIITSTVPEPLVVNGITISQGETRVDGPVDPTTENSLRFVASQVMQQGFSVTYRVE